MKKILALVACLSLVASLAIGGSIAYLTATDVAENTFTVGNVSIDINENGFVDGSPLKPGYPTEKKVSIVNTGNNDAWVFAKFIVEPSNAADIIELNYEELDPRWINKGDNTFVYSEPLKGSGTESAFAGETAELLKSVTLNRFVDVINGKLVKVENGGQSEICAVDEIKVIVNAYAIQADGIDNSDDAYEFYLQQWGDLDNANPAGNVNTFSEMNGALSKKNATVSLTKDLKMETTENVMMKNGGTLYGNNATITKTEYNGVGGNAGIETAGGTIEGLNVKDGIGASEKGFRAVYMTGGMKEDLIIDNCELEGTYAINVNGSKQDNGTTYKLIVNNSQLYGWVSYGTIIGSAEFNSVGFHKGTAGYKNLRAYADTTITDCNFDADYTIDVGPDATNPQTIKLAIVNSTYDGQLLTAENIDQMITNKASFKNSTITVDGVPVDMTDWF